jgi:glycine dehydrogenase
MDTNKFVNRHVGISAEEEKEMLKAIGVGSIDELINQTIPENIRLKQPINLP